MEKKDLRIYLDMRIKHLQNIDITQFDESQRELLSERKKGRILELVKLQTLLHQNQIKEADKAYWKSLVESES